MRIVVLCCVDSCFGMLQLAMLSAFVALNNICVKLPDPNSVMFDLPTNLYDETAARYLYAVLYSPLFTDEEVTPAVLRRCVAALSHLSIR